MAKKDKDFEDDSTSTSRRGDGKKNKNKRKKVELKEETTESLWGILFLVFGILILLTIFNWAGPAGNFIRKYLGLFFGFGYYLLPIILAVVGVSFMRKGKVDIARLHGIMGITVILSTLGIMDLATNGVDESTILTYGGQLGRVVAWIFSPFGAIGGIVLLGAGLVTSLIVLFDEKPNLITLWQKIKNIFNKEIPIPFTNDKENDQIEKEVSASKNEKENSKEPNVQEIEYSENNIKEKEEEKLSPKKKFHTDYVAPPLSLLEKDKGKPNIGDMKGNTNIIQRTLLNFGIPVEMDEVTVGPTVTRYALKPAQGVKLSRIVGLQNDLALALAAHPIRIEAPIPGKSLVGVEIPNKVKSTVGLATLLADDKFQNSPKPLTVALGRGLSGKAVFGNLAKMPHALIAGTTGSGKSVTIHSIITSLLYRNGPEDMKLIMVDPKRVELTLYNKIPHLLTPVITDPKKTILALKWAAKEMDRRYDVLQAESVRDIESYHSTVWSKSKDGEAERMPYIVIIIDELADIMQAYPRELESAIVRLAQMSRAVGIHLILSTQRPSVNVITGLIKANVPTRVALQVSSQIDSRTILDQGGAEKLLGAGDMLYASADMSQPERLQSAFISEDEVKRVVEYLKDAYMDEIPDQIELTGSIEKNGAGLFSDSLEGGSDGDDDLFEEAREIVIRDQKASTSYLQRKLGVGYARAAKLIDMLEERGVVGPGNGAKPRDVIEKPMNHTDDIVVGMKE